MKIKIDDIIKKYGMDYITAENLDIKGISFLDFEDAMHLSGRGICLDKEQDIYTNDLPLDERKSILLMVFGF